MPHTRVIEQLKDNLQAAYRKSIDADGKLDELKKSGHVKFNTIFTQDEGFSTRSNRFKPYVEELAIELEKMPTDAQALPAALEQFVRKLGVLIQTLQAFKDQAK
ncbi:prephenate dehydrogenase [Shewanella sp. D64]|uniref:prephenate dehydrogenase n=1 Tax=unclassified Shewanella TaxID=196818 RepID=UPI0022BA11B8|nr:MULTISPECIES: prephenate dehydrogenase [unclassified Shewanella]MEC4725515.1 prephenate dehydrogenase [Shewanella sp. D64]MEC4738666.1 prephenate dehydrogenase [Shewanella sp. E94]WBJ94963.1 prephenate dehydrogenase [Shewanella sp. MTB7]